MGSTARSRHRLQSCSNMPRVPGGAAAVVAVAMAVAEAEAAVEAVGQEGQSVLAE